MAKVTLHIIGAAPPWAKNYLDISGATAIKGLNSYPDYPGVKTLGRVYTEATKEPEPLNSLICNKEVGADKLFQLVWPEVKKNPHVYIWELYNEASIWNKAVLAGFPAFNQRLIQRMHGVNKRICVGAINTGWPIPAQYGAIAAACQGADGLSFHEYAARDMRNDSSILRYRRFHAWCQQQGVEHPPVWLTEVGLDCTTPAGPDHGHWGWQGILNNNEDSYVDQLDWYNQQLEQDDYVEAATVFTTGGDWPQFQFHESVAIKLAHRLHGSGGVAPSPEPAPNPGGGNSMITYLDRSGNKLTQAQFQALFGPVQVSSGAFEYPNVTLQAREGYATCIVKVLSPGRIPQTNERIEYSWPGGSYTLEVKPEGAQVNMGHGENYGGPPGKGPSAVQVVGNKSPRVDGVGWYDNYKHFDVEFMQASGEPDPEPEPEPEPGLEPDVDLATVRTLIVRAMDLLTQAIGVIDGKSWIQ